MHTTFAIDVAALEHDLLRRQPPRGRALVFWIARRILARFGIFYLVAFAVPALLNGHPDQAFQLANRTVQLELALAVAAAAGATWWSARTLRRQASDGVQESAKRLERDSVRSTQGRWWLRLLLWALAIAAALALVVGPLLVAGSPRSELLAESRPLTVLAFFGFSLAWAIPLVFAIRWYWLRWARRFIVAA